MKRAVFIGNRSNVIRQLLLMKNLQTVAIFVLKGSMLDDELASVALPEGVPVRIFDMSEKASVLAEITNLEFDLLISNGCPYVLPVSAMRKKHQLFINVHPTILPNLKGKTPLSGVFLTHVKHIGATMHYIDDGIDTGRIIHQEKTIVTSDLDQGLVYNISFRLEGPVFKAGMGKLAAADFRYAGRKQRGEGSYFNRTIELQTINFEKDNTDMILDKVRSFGFKGQGSFMNLQGIARTVYAAESIHNPYLVDAYRQADAGEVVLAYDDKCLVKTTDGLIKITDFTPRLRKIV